MNLLAMFQFCVFFCKMCHLLLKPQPYMMQKLLWQSQILIKRRISRCIRTLKHLHPLATIVLITSITFILSYCFESLEYFLLKLPFLFFFFCIHYANIIAVPEKWSTFYLFISSKLLPWTKFLGEQRGCSNINCTEDCFMQKHYSC